MPAAEQMVQTDVRIRLIQQKPYRAALPQALEDRIWEQGVSGSAERVLRVHWGEGYKQVCRGGTFITQISEQYMARLIGASVPTVQRAYRELKDLGFIRRLAPPRGPDRFKRPVTQTEVVIPPAWLKSLLASHDRYKAALSVVPPSCEPTADSPPPKAIPQEISRLACLPETWETCRKGLLQRLGSQQYTRYVAPLELGLAGDAVTLYAPNRFILDWVQSQLAADISRQLRAAADDETLGVSYIVGSTREMTSPKLTGVGEVRPVSRLSSMVVLRLGERLAEVAPGSETSRLLQEVLWSVLHGSFAKEAVTAKAMNACIKLVREGRWRRPKRMPSGWACAIVDPGRGGQQQ